MLNWSASTCSPRQVDWDWVGNYEHIYYVLFMDMPWRPETTGKWGNLKTIPRQKCPFSSLINFVLFLLHSAKNMLHNYLHVIIQCAACDVHGLLI